MGIISESSVVPLKILFVAMVESVHTARWINQIADQGWDIHLFPAYPAMPSAELRNVTIYGLTLFRPQTLHANIRYRGVLPVGRAGNKLEQAFFRLFPRLWEHALGKLIKSVAPTDFCNKKV